MDSCPKCGTEVTSRWERRCPSCEIALVYCETCGRHSELAWHTAGQEPRVVAVCAHCTTVIEETAHIFKSAIYRQFRYAFKFVNKVHVAYPMYFHGQFPFGEVRQDLGNFVNDFMFEQDQDRDAARMFGTDYGTARAYRVYFAPDGEADQIPGIVLSHETGLEVFLIAAGAFVGMEVAKFSLKVALEGIQRQINAWWLKRNGSHWDPQKRDTESLVESISVRTPHWEITVDGRFNQGERDRIFEHIGSILNPADRIEDFVVEMDDKDLAGRVVKATRRIVQRS